MTPEAFAAILAARTPGRWLVPLDIPNGVGEDIYEENQDKCLARWVDPNAMWRRGVGDEHERIIALIDARLADLP